MNNIQYSCKKNLLKHFKNFIQHVGDFKNSSKTHKRFKKRREKKISQNRPQVTVHGPKSLNTSRGPKGRYNVHQRSVHRSKTVFPPLPPSEYVIFSLCLNIPILPPNAALLQLFSLFSTHLLDYFPFSLFFTSPFSFRFLSPFTSPS